MFYAVSAGFQYTINYNDYLIRIVFDMNEIEILATTKDLLRVISLISIIFF